MNWIYDMERKIYRYHIHEQLFPFLSMCMCVAFEEDPEVWPSAFSLSAERGRVWAGNIWMTPLVHFPLMQVITYSICTYWCWSYDICLQAVSWSLDLQALARSHRGENQDHKARLCHVTRNPVQGLGITIRHVHGTVNTFTLSVYPWFSCDTSITRRLHSCLCSWVEVSPMWHE